MFNIPEHVINPDPEIFKSKNYVVLDFETTNIDKGAPTNKENKLLLAYWIVRKGDKFTTKTKWGGELELEELLQDIEQADFLVAHNAKFELGWLRRCGLDIGETPVFCTMLAEYVLRGNRTKITLGLEDCLRRRKLGGKDSVVSTMIKKGICPSSIPKKWLQNYCALDVLLCHKLFLYQLRQLDRYKLLPVFYCRTLLTPALADIENNGMHLDKDRVRSLYQEEIQRLEKLDKEFSDFTGGVNVKSTPQMAEFIYETLGFDIPKDHRGNELRTPRGLPATDAGTLEKLKATTKEQKQFIQLKRELTKVKDSLSKYLSKMYQCVEENDGILLADFNQTRTQTHRLSSSGKKYRIQLQNVPRAYKRLFSARQEDWNVVENDEGQLEYRTAVDMARDEAGLYDITHGVDSHGFTASIIYKEKWDPNNPDKKVRTAAKAHTFKPLYGGQSGTRREQEYYRAFKEKHKQITAMQQNNLDTVVKHKCLRIPSGLVLYWPDVKVQARGDSVWVTDTPAICNYPVQSFATADIVPLATVLIWHGVRNSESMNAFLISTVHDSCVAEVHKDSTEEYNELATWAMKDGVVMMLKKLYDYDFVTPLEAEAEICKYWCDEESGRY